MMRSIISVFISCAVLVSCSCKQQKKTVASEEPKKQEVAEKPVAPPESATISVADGPVDNVVDREANPQDNMYRLLVSFTSKGEGTDAAAGDRLLQIIKEHEEAFGTPLRYDRFQRGKEGEYTMCFKLLNESDKSKNNFISKVREELGKNELVIITENGEYKK